MVGVLAVGQKYQSRILCGIRGTVLARLFSSSISFRIGRSWSSSSLFLVLEVERTLSSSFVTISGTKGSGFFFCFFCFWHSEGHLINLTIFLFQSTSGLCLTNQSYPRYRSKLDKDVIANSIASTCFCPIFIFIHAV